MPTSNIFISAIDTFISERIEKEPKEKQPIVRFILERTRENVLRVASDAVGDADITLENISDVCAALDASSLTFDPAVLKSAGVEGLAEEINAYRRKVKWEFLISEIRKTISTDPTVPFTPDDIKNKNSTLFRALKRALKGGEENGEDFDWEVLRAKLPDDLASRFEPKKLSREERRQKAVEETNALIGRLNLTDVVSTLGHDPRKLGAFLDLTSANITDAERARILYLSFRGLREAKQDSRLNELMGALHPTLANIQLVGTIPEQTRRTVIRLTVQVPVGTRKLLVRGPTNRDININGNRRIQLELPPIEGEQNLIQLLAYDERNRARSELFEIPIEQISYKPDEDTLFAFLEAVKDEAFEEIRQDEKKNALFRKFIEESLIRHFAGDFEEGRAYVERLRASNNNPFVKLALDEVLEQFEEINRMEFLFIREDEHLMFFQKWCVQKIGEHESAVILANEPGLGKTVTALAATYDDESLYVCPNPAATTWVEQLAKFFRDPYIENLAGFSYAERERMLHSTRYRGILTNVEFMRRKGEGSGEARKFALLNRRRYPARKKSLVVDEAHFLKNDSQQTEGIGQLEYDRMLLLSASPFRNPDSFCRVMRKIFPEDVRFASLAAFQRAFPANDPAALKALYLLVQPHIIRFRKAEVLPTATRSRPLEDQPFALPQKRHIDPFATGRGQFMLTRSQQEAILEMFEDWNVWTAKYDHYMPRGELADMDGIRVSDDQLTKTHALRQIMNDPAYIGEDEPSPKREACMGIIREELEQNTKVVVFCKYHEQVRAYARMLEAEGIGFSMYTGEISKQGVKKDEHGREILFAVDEFDNYRLDGVGNPVPAARGERGKKMLAMDYERLTFQNNPDRKVMLATFSAGAQSVTFTAAGAMIFDDMPRDYTEQYQAEDRIHRIDTDRRKYEVRYYQLMANYSEDFLQRMRDYQTEKVQPDGETVELPAFERWFEQGTLDQVTLRNLRAQRTSFELLNDAIAVDPDMLEPERPFDLVA